MGKEILQLLKDIELHNVHVDADNSLPNELRDRLQNTIDKLEKDLNHKKGSNSAQKKDMIDLIDSFPDKYKQYPRV